MFSKSTCTLSIFKTVAILSANFITTLKKQTHLTEFKCWKKEAEVLGKLSG